MMPDSHGDIKPIPDPTRLTTEALMREVDRVEAKLNADITNLKHFHQLDLHRIQELGEARIQSVLDHAICIEEKVNEKLNAVKLQFDLVERQRRESKEDNQIALEAALAAMKDSLNALGTTYTSAHSALVALVDDSKGRITALESMRMGSKESNASMYAVLGIILTIIWIAIAILSYTHK